jgi:hypothetical protein
MKTEAQMVAEKIANNLAKIKLIEARMAKAQADEDY